MADSIGYVLDSAYAASPFYGNVLVARHGKILFERSYGLADVKTGKPLTFANSFQVASISKQFTAYGIMLLKQNGLLQYDSSVVNYIPSFPYRNITVRHLLQHTSGLPDFWEDIRPHLDTTVSNGNKEMLAYLATHQLPLQFEPGTKYAYADIGYDLLAMVIENLSGRNYQDFMNDSIFRPLKMNDTYAYMVTDIRRISNRKLAIGHASANKRLYEYAHEMPANNFVYYLGDFYGDGSVVTTARDLLVWDRALKSCTLLACSDQDEAFRPATNNDTAITSRGGTRIGFGWFISSQRALGRMLYHGGRHPGNMHSFYRFPGNDIVFIFLSNSEHSQYNALRNRLLSLLH